MEQGLGIQIAFFVFAALTVGSALFAAMAKNIVHSAFSLMATFFGVAGIYAILGSDFLAVTQVIVYVGGILILIVFGVLLTDRVPEEFRVTKARNYLPALIAAVSGRIAVPALPMKSRAGEIGGRWPRPCTVTVSPTCAMVQPSCASAASMTRVSSESSRS